MVPNRIFLKIAFALSLIFAGNVNVAQAEEIIVASTTSTQNSGLFDHLLPLFTDKTGIIVHVVAVGTGAALKLAREGDADVLLVHHKTSEEKFVRDGFGVERFDLMHNDFVVVGPQDDPAHVMSAKGVIPALDMIRTNGSVFLSRGDDSGTNKRELELWKEVGIDPKAASGKWYRETGSGMGATLNTASAMGGYALTDRATWISFKNKGTMKILSQGDRRLFNQYGVIMVNPAKFPHVKSREAKIFIDWLLSAEQSL